jgi:CHAT domain
MTRTTSDPPATADRTVRISAELRPAEGLVVVTAQDGPVAEFAYDQEVEEAFRNWPAWLRNKLLRTTQRTQREADYQRGMEDMARRLAALAGASELARLVTAANTDPSAPAFLRVELPQPELDIIPWELLASSLESESGGRRVHVYRTVRGRKQRQVTAADPPQRVVLADSSPMSEQLINFAQERASIQQELTPMRLGGLIDSDRPCADADPSALTGALAGRVRAVHFAAHGSTGKVHLRQGTKAVLYDGEAFAQFFEDEPVPAAVFLSVCDSVLAPPRTLGVPEGPGVARALAEADIAEVIGMYSVITPEAAKEFFTSLYRALVSCTDMVTAYAAAVTALQADTFPNYGFWSVPVLYSYDNVIPFPGTHGDPNGSYQRIGDQVKRFHTELSRLQPEEGWSETKWRTETMRLRVGASDRQHQLHQLIELVQHELRAGSKWAADVSRAARTGVSALDRVIARATSPRPGVGAVAMFAESKTQLTSALEELDEALSARLQFSR